MASVVEDFFRMFVGHMYVNLCTLFSSLAHSKTELFDFLFTWDFSSLHVLDINPIPEITADRAGASFLPSRKENRIKKGTVAPQSQKAQQ